MQILNRTNAPRYIRDGIVGHLLVSPRTCDARHLATSFVEIASGGGQRRHCHDPEQVYFIIEGLGYMTVGDELAKVEAGDCIYVPSGVSHGLQNIGDGLLRYLGIVSPSFSDDELKEAWPDTAESES
ncbi:MAG: cupin domain-containing protein [Planctomycetota bacterium]|nr:cupin domain-containing protein [Planctomycetota bacterium]MDA1164742.1 cupin domain-containing protein [Planctomycetota bacterium]